jgi:hypothetical protein
MKIIPKQNEYINLLNAEFYFKKKSPVSSLPFQKKKHNLYF